MDQSSITSLFSVLREHDLILFLFGKFDCIVICGWCVAFNQIIANNNFHIGRRLAHCHHALSLSRDLSSTRHKEQRDHETESKADENVVEWEMCDHHVRV